MYKMVVEIPKGWGVIIFSGQKVEIPGRALREIPSVVEIWIFSGTTQLLKLENSLR